ncbi:GFA family protein [Xanthobacter autotrophicus DSM 431]|uniref:GFA family protein n=1 Tax=Xanthobacter nonsaccharivorans TaxID=3119912 RepID=UPI0037283C1C
MAEPELEGGCLCGQLRYRIRRIHSVYWCHCTMCRRSSGSGAIPWVTVAREDFELIAGTPRAYASSPGVERRFCGACGSPIVFDMAREAQVDVTVGTLDAPDAVRPTHHIWSRSALHMTAGLGPDLPRYAAERPAEE